MIRVLIADDHELVRRGVRGLLKEAFPDVVLGEALDAAQTLAAVEKKAWDLVLLDINMPGRNGLDVLQDLKRMYPKLPVVMLSAFPEKDYAVRAFKLGAAAYVSKESASGEAPGCGAQGADGRALCDAFVGGGPGGHGGGREPGCCP